MTDRRQRGFAERVVEDCAGPLFSDLSRKWLSRDLALIPSHL